jgi:cytoskeletal protein RodZ
VGAKLKKARERRGISLRQVADSTKISVSVLQALERDDISYLPGGVVGRGFVRSFAAAVHLDPEAIVAEFVTQFPSDSINDGYPAAARVESNERPEPRASEVAITIHPWQPSLPLRLAAAGATAALVVYLGLAVTKTSPRWAEIQGNVITAATRLADNAIGTSAEPPARPAAPEVPVAVVANESTGAGVPPDEGSGSEPAAVAVSQPAVATPASPERGEPAAGVKTEAAPAAPPLQEPLKVMLSATSASWLIASVDGKKTINRLMEAGEQETLEARRELVLTAGNAGAIEMALNGAAAKSLGAAGATATVRVNRANLGNFLDVSRGE